jgi:hypothetical protein
MAIQTVTNENLAAFVAERQTKGSTIATGEHLVEAAQKAGAVHTEGVATPGNPVIKPGEAETVNAAPDPGNPQPTARTKPVQPRIDELTREKKEALELFEDEYVQRLSAESKVVELQKQLDELKPKAPEAVKPAELKRPSPKDFTDQDAYDKAMEAYDTARDERTRQAALEQGRQEARAAAQQQAMQAKVDQAKKDIPDFAEVVEAAAKRTTEVPAHIRAAFYELDYGPQIAYELAKDAGLEKRIFSLSPAKALSELGKLELKYANKPTLVPDKKGPEQTPIETTRAPAPLQSVRATGEGEVKIDLSKADFATYKQARLEELRKRRRH